MKSKDTNHRIAVQADLSSTEVIEAEVMEAWTLQATYAQRVVMYQEDINGKGRRLYANIDRDNLAD